MASKDFNAFMDSYITDIRDKKKNTFSIQRKKDDEYDENVPTDIKSDSVYVIKKPKTFIEKLKELFTSTDEEEFKEEPRVEKTQTIEQEQEFEQEYEELQTEERKSSIVEWLKSLFATNVNDTYEEIDEIPAEKVQKVMEENSIKTEDIQAKESEPEYENKEKRSFFGKILSFFGVSIEDADEEYDENTLSEETNTPSTQEMMDMKSDMKEVAIIATAAFKKLPKEQFKLFKESSDFAKFKVILTKHGVIREKGNKPQE